MTIPTKPIARTTNLELQELSGELLVYDVERHKAHCLNTTLASIWRSCDGTRDVDALAAKLQDELKTPIAAEVVWMALEQLSKNHLLQAPLSTPKTEKMTRREMARRVGAVVAIPAIASLLAPRAAQAGTCKQASGRDSGCQCSPPGPNPQCKSGVCNANRTCR
jgi:hypothetical protein